MLRTVACWSYFLGDFGDEGKGGSSPLTVIEELMDAEEDDEEEDDPPPLRVVEDEVEPSDPVREVPSISQVKGGPDTCMVF
jgi:hypothetical protein